MTTQREWSTTDSLLLTAVDVARVRNVLEDKPEKEWNALAKIVTSGFVGGRLTALVARIQGLAATVGGDVVKAQPNEARVLLKQGTQIARDLEVVRRSVVFTKEGRASAVRSLTTVHDQLVDYARVVGTAQEGLS